MHEIQNIAIIGAGNVAFHLAKAFHVAGLHICQVYSRQIETAHSVARLVAADAIDQLGDLVSDADLYVISLPDHALASILPQLNLQQRLVVHTSGSVPMQRLQSVSTRCGVFYPLQTFTKTKPVDFSTLPICLEAAEAADLEGLKKMAQKLSSFVREVDSEQRQGLHLAAVFACNFTNYMYTIAAQIMEHRGLAFDFLHPLVQETAQKIIANHPFAIQTGPAVRGDQATMEKHLDLLQNAPEWQQLYRQLSAQIESIHKK